MCCRRCGVVGSEQVSPPPLGWYCSLILDVDAETQIILVYVSLSALRLRELSVDHGLNISPSQENSCLGLQTLATLWGQSSFSMP